MPAKPEVKIPKGTKVLFRERVNNVLVARRGELEVDCVHENAIHVFDDERKNRKMLYLDEEGKTWVRGWTGKVATAFTRRVRAQAATEAREESARKKKEYEESIDYTVKRMRFVIDAIKRAKLPARYRAAAFAGLMTPGAMMPYSLLKR